MSTKLEQICGYLSRSDITHYPLNEKGVYQIIGPEPLDMSGNPSAPLRTEIKYVHGRYIDVLANTVSGLCSYWSRNNIPSDPKSGYIERIEVMGASRGARTTIPRVDGELEATVQTYVQSNGVLIPSRVNPMNTGGNRLLGRRRR